MLKLELGKASGILKDKDTNTEYFLLYLDEEFTLEEAIKLGENEPVYGVVKKGGGTKPRYALRFQKESELQAFAKEHAILDTSAHGKWKIQGIIPAVGVCGLLGFLTSRGFSNIDVLYMKDMNATFSAETAGDTTASFYMSGGSKIQLRFKAVNQIAKEHEKQQNLIVQAAKQPTVTKSSARTTSQQLFFQQHVARQQERATKADGTAAEPPKRPQTTKTGLTPDSKKAREEP